MEKLKVDMDKVAQIGGKRMAAPPGDRSAAVSLDNAARYYREALEMGEKRACSRCSSSGGRTRSSARCRMAST